VKVKALALSLAVVPLTIDCGLMVPMPPLASKVTV
jgi:hypothetical protein